MCGNSYTVANQWSKGLMLKCKMKINYMMLDRIWFEMTLNYQMMVERYPNHKEEVGDLNPGCEISSLPNGKLARWSTASYALALAYRPFVSKKKEQQQNGKEFSLPLNVAVIIEGAREAGDLKLLRVVLEIILREPVGQFTHLRVLRNVERFLQHLGCNIIRCHQDLQRSGNSSFRNLCLELPGYLRHMKPKELQQQQQ